MFSIKQTWSLLSKNKWLFSRKRHLFIICLNLSWHKNLSNANFDAFWQNNVNNGKCQKCTIKILSAAARILNFFFQFFKICTSMPQPGETEFKAQLLQIEHEHETVSIEPSFWTQFTVLCSCSICRSWVQEKTDENLPNYRKKEFVLQCKHCKKCQIGRSPPSFNTYFELWLKFF